MILKIYSSKRDYSRGSNSKQNGEEKTWEFIQKKFSPNVVFDVGIEAFSYIADNLLNDKIDVFLFEPNLKWHQQLISRYSGKKNIFLQDFGFGDKDNQIIKLYPSTGSTFFRDKTIPINRLSKENIDIKIRTIENFVSENNIKKIDFLKIDVEGYELNVLLGAKSFLENIELIQFEYGGTYIDAEIKLQDILSLFPKRLVYAIEKEGLNLRKIPEIYQEEINYKYTNFLISKNRLEEL
jgi:FkbM family methyltransferase